ncbi:hypothetical protein PHET_03560 [Paragonimus heterotremus]|uniref:Uncharacterized protein n=1 Tax=Paragonimus heterotremus TaxID=100268 RepID=A0A8J4SNX9_9TREM|nr:hypothetical protein PHET_03560 [Paragonimus heterotremus]
MAEMEFLFHVENTMSASSVRRVFFHTEFTVRQLEHSGVPRVVHIVAPGPVVGDLALRVRRIPMHHSFENHVTIEIQYRVTSAEYTNSNDAV